VSSELTLVIRVARSASESSPVVSSAYKILNSSVAFGRSFIKHRKRVGPRIVPWKTDISRFLLSERVPLISTF
jgi:hypothetical protein